MSRARSRQYSAITLFCGIVFSCLFAHSGAVLSIPAPTHLDAQDTFFWNVLLNPLAITQDTDIAKLSNEYPHIYNFLLDENLSSRILQDAIGTFLRYKRRKQESAIGIQMELKPELEMLAAYFHLNAPRWFADSSSLSSIRPAFLSLFHGANEETPIPEHEIERKARVNLEGTLNKFPGLDRDQPDVWAKLLRTEMGKIRFTESNLRRRSYGNDSIKPEDFGRWVKSSRSIISKLKRKYLTRVIELGQHLDMEFDLSRIDGGWEKALADDSFIKINETDPLNHGSDIPVFSYELDGTTSSNWLQDILGNDILPIHSVDRESLPSLLEFISYLKLLNTLSLADDQLVDLSFNDILESLQTKVSPAEIFLDHAEYLDELASINFESIKIDDLHTIQHQIVFAIYMRGLKSSAEYGTEHINYLLKNLPFQEQDQAAENVKLGVSNGVGSGPLPRPEPYFKIRGHTGGSEFFFMVDESRGSGQSESYEFADGVQNNPDLQTMDEIADDELLIESVNLLKSTSHLGIPLPLFPGYKIKSLYVRNNKNKPIDFQLVKRSTEQVFHSIRPRQSSNLRISILLKKINSVEPAIAEPTFSSTQLIALANYLDGYRLGKIASELRLRAASGAMSATELAEFYRTSTLYTDFNLGNYSTMYGPSFLVNFLNDIGQLCIQCSGAAYLLTESFQFIFRDFKEEFEGWSANTKSGLRRHGNFLWYPFHAVTELTYEGNHFMFLDSTPTTIDHRSSPALHRYRLPRALSHISGARRFRQLGSKDSTINIIGNQKSENSGETSTSLFAVDTHELPSPLELSVRTLEHRLTQLRSMLEMMPTIARQIFRGRDGVGIGPVAHTIILASIARDFARGKSPTQQECWNIRINCAPATSRSDLRLEIQQTSINLQAQIKMFEELKITPHNQVKMPEALLKEATGVLNAIDNLQWPEPSKSTNKCSEFFKLETISNTP